jgi:Cd2+/Zn2+-exporting ATPase
MSNSRPTRIYEFSGIDCPDCASRVEKVLKGAEGLENTVVDFAGGVIHINPAREDAARRLLGLAEPGAGILLPRTRQASRTPWTRRKFRVPLLPGLSFLFFAGAMVLSAGAESPVSAIVETLLFSASYLTAGWPVLRGTVRNIFRGRIIDELFLMTLATAGAIAIGELPEAAAVMLFYTAGEHLQSMAVSRSRDSIRSAMALRVESARVVDGENSRTTDPENVSVGDIVEVWPGESVPLDGTVVRGETWMNTSALTGESTPRRVCAGDSVSAGYVNDDGVIRFRVDRNFGDSAFSRVKRLLEEASARKSPTEMLLSRFAAVYTPVVVALAAALVFIMPLFFKWSYADSIHGALVLLVISCPCALVVSVPLAYFAGIGRASRSRILLRGADVLDAAGKIGTVVFDKTGTLTEGRFRLTSVQPAESWTEDQLLRTANAALSLSNHPIARSVREYRGSPEPADAVDEFREIKGSGVTAQMGNSRVIAGNAGLLEREGVRVPAVSLSGTVVHVASDGVYAGHLLLSDSIKTGSAGAVADLRKLGVGRIAMLTGDRREQAEEAASKLAITEVHAQLLPEDKMRILESIIEDSPRGAKVGFAGDGLNDAPAIIRADVGMAMGGSGTDLAIESADVVFMDDDPSGIPVLIRLARFTRRVVVVNILFALAVKVFLMGLGVFAGLPMWAAVIGDVGVTLIAVLNSLRILGNSAFHGVTSG